MRFVGIDVGGERHVAAVVDESGTPVVKPTPFREEASGYHRLVELLGNPADCLVAMEATGHYWRNLFAWLLSKGFSVALLNPLRTRRFAEEELERTKTDAIDAFGIARFAQQKRPAPAHLPDAATEELRELVPLRERLLQDFGDRVRQLHRAVDLGFPEFTHHVQTLDSELASAILSRYPTAAVLRAASAKQLARLCYDGRHQVGEELSRALIEAAKNSVGHFHAEPYQLQVKYACEDLGLLRRRLKDLEREIARNLDEHESGKLLTTIDGIARKPRPTSSPS